MFILFFGFLIDLANIITLYLMNKTFYDIVINFPF